MSTTIDSAGRLVVPKNVRDAMGLRPGTPVDVTFTDGRIEIEFAPMEASVDTEATLPRIVAADDVTTLTDEDVRTALESTRR
ncbi:AbrB/MazE/SpoVT family DNA-binding domain-containing protein [Humibacter sp.]|uniref:AbrB/MazE/SpoVT family DNA-binding domain-containing protein n=1 Tax=Humibacter sp. TaxID=1940291 RepID=UPI003F80981F